MQLTAPVLRAVQNFTTRTRGEEPSRPLSTGEYAYIQILWIHEMQQSIIKTPKFKELKQWLGLHSDATSCSHVTEDYKMLRFYLMPSSPFSCYQIIT